MVFNSYIRNIKIDLVREFHNFNRSINYFPLLTLNICMRYTILYTRSGRKNLLFVLKVVTLEPPI